MNNIDELIDDVKDLKKKVLDAEYKWEQMAYKTGQNVGTMSTNYTKTGRKYVVENPIKGIAIAAATGAIIGRLITCGMSRRE